MLSNAAIAQKGKFGVKDGRRRRRRVILASRVAPSSGWQPKIIKLTLCKMSMQREQVKPHLKTGCFKHREYIWFQTKRTSENERCFFKVLIKLILFTARLPYQSHSESSFSLSKAGPSQWISIDGCTVISKREVSKLFY